MDELRNSPKLIGGGYRNQYIDILKGIGILSVVLGHAYNGDVFYSEFTETLRKFLYIYHLPIFFFVQGYLYRDKPIKGFIIGFLKKQYVKYIFVGLVALLLAPLWSAMGVIRAVDTATLLLGFLKSFTFRMGVPLTGAMWFCTVHAIMSIANFVLGKIPNLIRMIVYMLAGIVGVISTDIGQLQIMYLNVVLLMLPISYAGILYREYEYKIRNLIKGWMAIPIAGLMLDINQITGLQVELSKDFIYGGILFYPMIMLGIVFCLTLAILIQNGRCTKALFTEMGKQSYGIMAFHFMAFKVVDYIGYKVGFIDKKELVLFPISNPSIRIVYFIFGLGFTYLCCSIGKKVVWLLKSKISYCHYGKDRG